MNTKKYSLDTAENRSFLVDCTDRLLAFGRRFPSPEGGSWYLGSDGAPLTDRPRETWITSRMVHVYCLGILTGRPGSRELAAAALKGLTGELRDREHGGWYAGRLADGGILPGKHCYAHAFVILAASSAVIAGIPGADALLKEALEVYDRYFWDESEGMPYDSWDTDFTRPEPYRGLNASMHSVEAFLAAADALDIAFSRTVDADAALGANGTADADGTAGANGTADADRAANTALAAQLRKRAERVIHRVISFAKPNSWRTPEHFDESWRPMPEYNRENPEDPFKPYGATPGHGLEWARLIVQWALSACDNTATAAPNLQGNTAAAAPYLRDNTVAAAPDLQGNTAAAAPYLTAAEQLYARAVSDGWAADGAPGFCYTTDWNGTPVVHDRMHWTLAEAINTSAVLARVTDNPRYREDYARYLQYLDQFVLDHETGSWFHQLDGNNRLLETVWPGKPDLYHAVQAMLIPYQENPSLSIAAALSQNAR